MTTQTMIVRLELPVLYCHTCRAQVALTDAVGRWTAPAFLVPLLDARTVLCVWDARRVADPSTVVPFAEGMAVHVPGCAPALPVRELFDLLVSLGATLVEPGPSPVARGPVR